MTLGLLFSVRYALADRWLWAGSGAQTPPCSGRFNYDIHGLVTVRSDARLPELERFRIDGLLDHPTRPRAPRPRGSPRRALGALVRIRYREWGPVGFGCEITDHGDHVDIVATRWLSVSPARALHEHRRADPAVDVRQARLRARARGVHRRRRRGAAHHRPHGHGQDDHDPEDPRSPSARLPVGRPTLVSPDGRVLTYPKPLTISSHTVASVKTPLLSRVQRITLPLQSRLHSRSGRRFAMLIARTHLPAATINGVVQALIPPPKYHVDKLVPGVAVAPGGRAPGMVIIQRGGLGDVTGRAAGGAVDPAARTARTPTASRPIRG